MNIYHHLAETAEAQGMERIPAGSMNSSHLGCTATFPWEFRGHAAAITGTIKSIHHARSLGRLYVHFEIVEKESHYEGRTYRSNPEDEVIIHPEESGEDSGDE